MAETSSPDLQDLPDDLIELEQFDSLKTAHEFGLVILSQRAPYWIRTDEGVYRLLVEAQNAAHLAQQLALYRKESVNWPPLPPVLPEHATSSLPVTCWIAVLTFCHLASNVWPQLYTFGRASSTAIAEGEIYRAFTALFLHADPGHLGSNLLFGSIFLYLAAHHLGGLRAWLLILASGTFGNLLNAWIHYPSPHFSIGASTAIFGAVGILAALPAGLVLSTRKRQPVRTWLVPLGIGLIFLGWLGTGNERTDTSAHLTGFLCGLPLGLIAAIRSAGRDLHSGSHNM